MKISSRERALLLIMAMLLFVIMPYILLIQPILVKSQENLKTFSQVSEKAASMEFNIQSSINLDAKKAELEDRLETEHTKIPTAIRSYNIHYTFTDICGRSGAKLETLSIGDYTMISSEEADIKFTSKYFSQVNMEIKGTLAQILDTAQAVNDEGNHLLLTDFTVSGIGKDEILTATIGVKIFAVEKLKIENLPVKIEKKPSW